MPVVGCEAARMCLRLWRTCSCLSVVKDVSFGLRDEICCITHVSKWERVRIAMRKLIGIRAGAVWLAQKGRIFKVVAGAKTRGRCWGCTLGCGISVGVVVVVVGGRVWGGRDGHGRWGGRGSVWGVCKGGRRMSCG